MRRADWGGMRRELAILPHRPCRTWALGRGRRDACPEARNACLSLSLRAAALRSKLDAQVSSAHMRLHIFSDLHLEFAPLEPPDMGADVVILAGDIHLQTRGVGWAAETFQRPVIYVPGNHEYYGGHFKNTLAKMRDRGGHTQVHVLDRDEVVIDGVRFLGTTLWTDFSATGNLVLAALEARQRMTDYQ